jgi:pimeloyl-ACP methyl ester carboxylesterase
VADAALLLHGQPGTAADWSAVISALGRGSRVVAIDRPGWDGAGPARDLAGNVAAALAALDARGIARAVVAGHSLGAAVAVALAARHPHRVTALVLAAPAANAASLDRIDRWLAAPGLAELAAVGAMGGVGLAASVAGIRRRMARTAGVPEEYLAASRRTLLAPRAWRAYAVEQRALVRDLPALEPELATTIAPATILAGDQDHIVDPAAARRLAEQLPCARLELVPGAGHLLPQCEPERVAAAIAAALAGTLDGA